MEHRHIDGGVNAETYNYPTFMTVKEHPLNSEYNGVKAMMTAQTGDAFVAGIRQRIEREPDNEKKTRIKCKSISFETVFIHIYYL